jgi:TonB family protein
MNDVRRILCSFLPLCACATASGGMEAPPCPAYVRAAGGGCITVAYVLSSLGEIEEIRIVSSDLNPRLEEEALREVRSWRFVASDEPSRSFVVPLIYVVPQGSARAAQGPFYLRVSSRVEPRYPDRAAFLELEGFVHSSFVVSFDGSVTDIVVVEAEPGDLFEKVAVDALRRWKYPATGALHAGREVRLDFELGP